MEKKKLDKNKLKKSDKPSPQRLNIRRSNKSDSDSISDSDSPHANYNHRSSSSSTSSPSSSSIYSDPSQSPYESFDHAIYASDPFPHLRLAEFNFQSFVRHGFNHPGEYPGYIDSLSKSHQSYWDQSPYKNIKPADLIQIPYWTQPPKHRTACAALFLCLRLGFEPPDIVKASPAPALEAWVNPKLLPKDTALESIAKRLQDQFESLAPTHARVKFKAYADVYAEEFKKTLLGLRKYSKLDRCLVYYNGHGVPKPTATGEIWVFNKAYTQYIPIRLHDILTWVGTPVVFIWDCNNAGQILDHLIIAANLKDEEEEEILLDLLNQTDPDLLNQNLPSIAADPHHDHHSYPLPQQKTPSLPPSNHLTQQSTHKPSQNAPRQHKNPSFSPPRTFSKNTIQLAACQPDELLPRDPRLPADVFTSCLTSPIEMALRFYVLRNNSPESTWTSTSEFFQDLEKLKKVPGRMEMRRTPLGELTWIFTSIADAIAWNHLDRQTFTKIFRGDLVLAGTFRGFLLAERVMKSYGCTPMSVPRLPATHHSELWQTWDLEVDMCLSQLIEIWKSEAARTEFENNKHNCPPNTLPPQVVTYKPSTFFSQQLTAFDVWLKAVVAENQHENGEKDEDLIKAKETLQWSCNDWSGVNMNKIEISDFSCSDPKPCKDKHSSTNLNGKSHGPQLSTTSVKPNTTHSPPSVSSQDDDISVESAQRPIRYRLPTFIKRFPLNSRKGDDLYPPSPPQLPIVLQVLLSPLHRLRALILLCRLMDLGPWAVHLSLSIGIFQYVLKLLQAPAAELKPVLIFIWARILTVYPEGRQDLMRCVMRPLNRPEMPIEYFIKIMAPHSMELPIVNVVDHKAMCAFILSISCKNSRANSQALFVHGVLEIIMHRIKELVPWQRQWYLILLAHMWEVSDVVKGRAIKLSINTILSDLLTDKVPEVRTAALYAFGTLIGVSTDRDQTEVEDQVYTSPRGSNDENRKPVENETEPADIKNHSDSPVSKPSKLTPCQMNKLTSLSSSNPSLTQLGYQEQILIEVGSAMACCHCSTDGSPMFRQELVVVLSALVDQHLGHFIVAAFEFVKQQEKEKSLKIGHQIRKYLQSTLWGERPNEDEDGFDHAQNMITDRTAKLEKLIHKLKADEEVHPKESLRAYLWMEYTSIYIVLLDLSLDPSNQVAKPAETVVDYIHSRLMDSVLGKWLELDYSLNSQEEQNLNSIGADNNSFDDKRQSSGRLDDYSHSTPTTSIQSSKPVGGDKRATSNGSDRTVPHRSSTSVFTVNSLVPNFVKSSGWKTPFNALSRSPEQSNLTSPDRPISSIGSSRDLNNNEHHGLRKLATLNPSGPLEPPASKPNKAKVPISKPVNSFGDPSSCSSKTQTGTDADHSLQSLLTDQSLESIIAKTRASDHIRRQIARSYPLQHPLSASPNLMTKEVDKPLCSSRTSDHVSLPTSKSQQPQSNQLQQPPSQSQLPPQPPSPQPSPQLQSQPLPPQQPQLDQPPPPQQQHQQRASKEAERSSVENDYLYYLGLQNPEKLNFELNNLNHLEEQQQQQNSDHRRKRILPLLSNYYEFSSQIFLKPKMTNPAGDSESESSSESDNNEVHEDPQISQQQKPSQQQTKSNIIGHHKLIVFNHHRNFQAQAFNNHHQNIVNNSQVHEELRPTLPLQHPLLNASNVNHLNLHSLKLTTDQGSLENVKDSWRKQRNLKLILDSPTFKSDPPPCDWSNLVCSFDHSKPINNLIMHPFEDQLIGSDSDGYINVFDLKSQSLSNRFLSSSERPSRITSLQLINQDSHALLLSSTPAGNLRIFRNYERAGRVELVTAFKGLPNNEPSRNGESGVVTDWQQSTGLLVVGGNSREIKVWNSRRESCIENIKTRSNSCLSAITSEKNLGFILVTGFGDGTIRIFDRRKPSKNSMVKVLRNFHNSWCSNIKFQSGNCRDLVSGDTTGLVAQWDLRLDLPIHSFLANPEGMPVFDLHDHSPILASGSINGGVKLWDLSQEEERNSKASSSTRSSTEGRNFSMLYNFKSMYHHQQQQDDLQQQSILNLRFKHKSNLNHSSSSSILFGNNSKIGQDVEFTHSSLRDQIKNSNQIGFQPIIGLSFHPYQMLISMADSNGKLNVYSTTSHKKLYSS